MEKKRVIRHFSEAFKREKVKMIEKKEITVKELSQLYEVSDKAIYNWLKKYSSVFKTERIVIEKESEGHRTKVLLQKVADLERKIGQQELKIDYLKKVLETASKELGFDIEKKYNCGSSNSIEPIEIL